MKLPGKQIVILVLAFALGAVVLIQLDKLISQPMVQPPVLNAKQTPGSRSPTPSAKPEKKPGKSSGRLSDSDSERARQATEKATGKTKAARKEHATTKTLQTEHRDDISSGVISGTIRNRSDAPIPNALVELFRTNDLSAPCAFQTTAETGAFRFVGLPPGIYEILTSHVDYASECLTNITLKEDQTINGLQVVLGSGAEVKGIVVDTNDKPIEQARIRGLKKILRVIRSGGEAISGTYRCGEARTDKTGRFSFLHLPEGENQLVAQKDGYAVETISITLKEGASSEEVKIVLKPAGVIAGQVLSPLRKPIAKAKISATSYLAKDGTKSNVQNVPPATSDDSGRFTLKNLLSEGAYDVTVEAENFARGFFRRINVNTLNNTFVLQNGGSVSGMVKRLENNQPVKRVGMIVMSEDERFPYVAQALTNEKGLYAFLGVPPGAYTVAVNSTSLTAADYKGVKVESNKDVTGIDFLVYQGLTVNGKVVDSATGTAVADAEVKARARVGAFLEASTKLSTHTDDDGTFVMKNLRAGIYYFSATAEGYLKINDVAKQQRIELSLNKPPPFVKIKVYRGGEVNGKVINEAGSTLPFAFVQLFQSPQTPTQINTRELQATTDISGNFTINGIWIAQPVELYASAFAQGYAKGKSDQVILTDYSPSASITVTLRKGILLTGTVSDSEKKPISGATISASPVMFEGDSFTAPYATISSESGEYQIANVPAGKAWVDATAPGYVPYRKKIEFSSDEQIKKLDIVLSKGLIITGYVMDDLGRPIENADVSVSNPSGAGRPGKSDAIGFYQILDLENRHYDLIAGCSRNTATGSQSYYSQRRDIPAGRESVSFVFLINASLQGRVVNQNSVPIQRFGISISAQVDTGDGTTGGFSTGKNFNDATGEFHLTDLPTGSYDLVFSADGCAKLELRDIRVDSPSSRQLGDIELQDGGKLQARIISSLTGEPVAGAGGTLEPQPGGQGSSNLDGILTINSLAAGSYNLSITHSHYLSCIVSPVVIAEDQTTDLGDITLTPGGIIEGFVSDGDGAPLQGITVSAEGGYGSPHLSGQTDIGGHYFIDGVQEGLTTVRAEGTVHGQKCFKSRVVNILADDRAKVDFVLDPSCNIAGRIYSAAFSLHNMLVVAYQVDESNHIDDAMKTVGSIAAEGTYRISDIVAGEYFLTAEGKVMNPPQGVPSRIIRTFERLSVYNTETLRDIEFSNARVEGIIVARSDGTPIQRAQLKLIYNDGPAAPSQIANRYFVFAARSNNDGFFWFYGLPPGHYDLYAARPSGTWEHCESIYLSHRAAVSEITCSIE